MALASRAVTRKATAAPAVRAVPARVNLRVVAKAGNKVEAAAKFTLPLAFYSLAASPAFALVDERLNGDGTGRPLGINDGALGWTIFGVFSLIWIAYFISQKDFGDFEDEDSGLKL